MPPDETIDPVAIDARTADGWRVAARRDRSLGRFAGNKVTVLDPHEQPKREL